MNLEEEIIKKICDQFQKDIDTEILNTLKGEMDESYSTPDEENMQYNSKLNVLSPEYLYQMKKKTELLLGMIIEKYKLGKYISIKYRYRLDMERYSGLSEHYELYKKRKDINGKQLASGYDYIPTSFDEWIEINFPDYSNAINIYNKMCERKIVEKEDLLLLNKIAKKYEIANKNE